MNVGAICNTATGPSFSPYECQQLLNCSSKFRGVGLLSFLQVTLISFRWWIRGYISIAWFGEKPTRGDGANWIQMAWESVSILTILITVWWIVGLWVRVNRKNNISCQGGWWDLTHM